MNSSINQTEEPADINTGSNINRLTEIIEGQSEILGLISQGKPLALIFDKIVQWVEKYGKGNLLASILTLNEVGDALLHGAAPSLPESYNAAIHGIKIGPGVGSCGTAAFTAKQVIVENIETDPLWKDFKDLAIANNLRACWSSPLLSNQGRVLGTFAIYYSYPNKPTSQDFELIRLVSRTAVLAIEFHNAERERHLLLDREKANIEQSRTERKKFYQLLMDSPAMIAVLNGPDHVFELTNEMYDKAVGQGRPLLGLPVAEALPEVVEPGFITLLDHVYQTGEPFFGNEVMLKLDRQNNGQLEDRYMNFLYQPIKDETGKPEGIFVHAVDITDQVVARKKVEESEQQARALVESAPFPIGVYVGKEMKIILANQSIIDIWGKGNDVIGRSYKEILPELSNQAIFDQLESVYTTGKPFHARNQRVDIIIDDELTPFYFNYSFTPLFDAEGHVYGVMNTGADITDLMTAQHNLAEAQANLQNAIEVAELGTWRLKFNNQRISFSSRLGEWFGLSESEVPLEEMLQCIPDEDRQHVEAVIQNTIKTGEPYEVDHCVINKVTGELRVIHVQGKVWFNHLHEPSGINGAARDITLQKMAERELERQVELRTVELRETNIDLHNVNENLQQFAYVASHDLQEPLRKINLYADVLLNSNKENLTPGGKSYLTKMGKAAKRMSELIKDLLEFSKVRADANAFKQVDLNEVLSNIRTDFEVLIAQKEAEVVIGSLCSIEAVPLQMNQLFYNLIGNALKFTKENTRPLITIQSRTLDKGEILKYDQLNSRWDYCEISVSDNGIGFNEQFAEQIFEIFQRLHSKDEFEGTGIGLALCKKIVSNHGGLITASSSEGKGTTFHVILPVGR